MLQLEKDQAKEVEEQAALVFPSPQPGPQTRFLEATEDIVFFGGAAGGGKSTALLMAIAQQELIDEPLYRGVIFRRTTTDLKTGGGLWDSSKELYYALGGRPRENSLDWLFPPGSRINLAHLEHEKTKYSYKGAQLERITFDEVTEFSEETVTYMLSRNRSRSGLRCQLICTMNPDAESWVAEWVDWYIDPETGYPLQERNGVRRYLLRLDETNYWADTEEELKAVHGEDSEVLSFVAIFATIYDNPILLKNNPRYLASLNALHPVERARLLFGNWKAKFVEGDVFKSTWFNLLAPEHAPFGGSTVRYWDLAATAKQLAKATHYYTAGTKMRQIGDRTIVLHSKWEQVGPADVEDLIVKTAQADGVGVMVRWEIEGGAEALIFCDRLKKRLRSLGVNADYCQPKGDKLTRAIPYATAASNNQVWVVDGVWREEYLSCLQRFDGSPKPKVNDVTDSSTGAFNELNKRAQAAPAIQPKQRDLKRSRVFG